MRRATSRKPILRRAKATKKGALVDHKGTLIALLMSFRKHARHPASRADDSNCAYPSSQITGSKNLVESYGIRAVGIGLGSFGRILRTVDVGRCNSVSSNVHYEAADSWPV